MAIMASLYNLSIYAEAAKGRRVFAVPTRNAVAIAAMFRRKGYKVTTRKSVTKPDVVNIFIR